MHNVRLMLAACARQPQDSAAAAADRCLALPSPHPPASHTHHEAVGDAGAHGVHDRAVLLQLHAARRPACRERQAAACTPPLAQNASATRLRVRPGACSAMPAQQAARGCETDQQQQFAATHVSEAAAATERHCGDTEDAKESSFAMQKAARMARGRVMAADHSAAGKWRGLLGSTERGCWHVQRLQDILKERWSLEKARWGVDSCISHAPNV
jgi:hypothetical protein